MMDKKSIIILIFLALFQSENLLIYILLLFRACVSSLTFNNFPRRGKEKSEITKCTSFLLGFIRYAQPIEISECICFI
ncbi:hypothetical protein GLOIN_2v1559540 [Rhizophagus irregularis DAOM 181602=DAOM 197198]|uniref:Uncharacterized protein n=1 Tax=Rhizophagus irregularis (strain DAOM 181602 / DAOM 197198 / MUCL 43194) TaxID=747089 RepID=A0A2P4QEH6_RHIID|nr:hypothetical protein GLOIN_2v1559540 [Rhizophagus irregularis DAOM 181602=DAOM 197198]POG76045.1 hypothetical protein GLOIN_2v1559540 [Rhizophagus irregularis DAOM 181602=DAOM 197198]|eukprot:XP_025182911.1 hypothetical protein GLOIN_2v1559540 [Rhizophagus irregularis DAOM 181602=DAOM 197198]